MLKTKRTRVLIDNIIFQHEFSILQERSYQISIEAMIQFQLKL